MSMRESCGAIEPLLAAYGEPDAPVRLTAEEQARVTSHMAECEPCRRHAEASREVRAALRARAGELITPAPPRLTARCRAAAARRSAPRTAARWAGWSAAAAATAAILFVFLMPTQAVATQLAADHLKCAKFAAGSVITGTPSHLEKVWLAKRNHDVTIPEGGGASGLRLLGLRRCVSTEGNMAHVMYDRHGSAVSLFIYDARGGRSHETTQLEAVGHKTILWTARGNTYALVGRSPDLIGAAALLWQQLEKTKD